MESPIWRGLASFDLRGQQLATLLCGSLVCRLGEESLWVGLARLARVYLITGQLLVTAMSGSLAARVGDEQF